LKGRELVALRRRIGLLPQLSEINALAPLTVRDVVAIGRAGLAGLGQRLSASDREAVDSALSAFGLEPLAERLYSRVSGGEQRKAQLARVFAQGPELLLLDEPMANLDFSWQERLRREIAEVWERTGMTIIMVTHESHHLPEPCNLAALVSAGRLIAAGPSDQTLRPETLVRAYGPGLQVFQSQGRTYTLGG